MQGRRFPTRLGRSALAGLALALPALAQPEDRKLAEIPEGIRIGRDLVPTTNLGAFVRRRSIAWSPDGTKVAYAGIRESEAMPIVNSRVGKVYNRVNRPTLAGGRAFFHVLNQVTPSQQKHWVWIDGITLKAEDWIARISVSPAGDRVAYWTHPGARTGNTVRTKSNKHYLAVATARKSGKWKVFRGEKHFQPGWLTPVWSGDAKLLFTCGLTRKGWAVLRVRKREKQVFLAEKNDQIASIAVSETGAAVAFIKTDMSGARSELYFRGRRIGAAHPMVAKPAVDPAGVLVAYVMQKGDGVSVSVGNETHSPGKYGYVRELAFSPKGDRLAFVAVAGGRPSDESPDIIEGGEWFVVLRSTGGKAALKELPRYREVRDLVWDAEGKRLAYAARDEKGWRIICEKAKSGTFKDVGRPHFLPDGAAVGHGALAGRELWWKVLRLD